MIIKVKVIPNTKIEKIIAQKEGDYKIWVKVKPIENEANFRIIEILANHFGIAKSEIRIKSGLKSRNKIVEIGS